MIPKYFKIMINVTIKLKPKVVPHIFDYRKTRKPGHSTSAKYLQLDHLALYLCKTKSSGFCVLPKTSS